jgi:3-oxoacyl-[acyl-carrier protein] reductase
MNNKIILITGTRKGIGYYMANYYLNNNYTVIGCSRSAIDINNENYFHYLCDVRDEQSVISTIISIRDKFKKIDILINNAGIASLNHFLLTPGSTLKKIFETNTFGTFYFSRECAKLMIKNKWGRIINFTTVAVPLNLEGELVYASSKSAVEKMSKIMSRELSTYNITVNTIGPTPINTDLIKTVPKDKLNKIIHEQTIKRLGNYSDIINVINFYINEKSDFITGQNIYLGGL